MPLRALAALLRRRHAAAMTTAPDFAPLLDFLVRMPAMSLPAGRASIGTGAGDGGRWLVKFQLDIEHPLAWHVVQELGHVLNLLSVEERLPTSFQPVSPPPYLNGGPEDYLSWVIAAHDPEFTPKVCAEWLETRLPQPVDDATQWGAGGEGDDDDHDDDDGGGDD